MRILFNSKDKIFKTPFGTINKNEECVINIHIPQYCFTTEAELILESVDDVLKFPMTKEKNYDNYEVYTCRFSLNKPNLYFYYFYIKTKNSDFYLYKCGYDDTNIGVGEKWQLTCHDKIANVSDDFVGKVMYQIFPDRFYRDEILETKNKLTPYYIHKNANDIPHYAPDSEGRILNNDFFGGNLSGICKKLDYLKDLNVSVIYLNPIFKAYSNHRYDTCDYKQIDCLLGDENDFSKLCKMAHERDMKIILDGVFSHTGSNSIYFDKEDIFKSGAYSNPNSPYRNWYKFFSYPNGYESWWGIDTLPTVDKTNRDFIEYIITGEDSVIRHWLNLGADGFRLDVADELTDEFILLLHDTARSIKKDSFIIGEVWEDASNKIAYGKTRKYFSHGELDSVMNYPFRNAIIDLVCENKSMEEFSMTIMNIAENYPKQILNSCMNILSTHDTPRILTVLSKKDLNIPKDRQAEEKLSETEKNIAKDRLISALTLQFFLPGSPCIYYGDEICMEGYADPFNRGYFKWDNINEPIRKIYKTLSSLKAKESAMIRGDVFCYVKGDVLFIKRNFEKNTLTLAYNGGSSPCDLSFFRVLFFHKATIGENTVFIQKGGVAVFEDESKI